LDYLAALPEKLAPHTLSFAALFRSIIGTYKELVPRILKERPEIMKKLKTMQEDNENVKSKVQKAGFPNR
jgi:DNA polymerase elongation subunit (family B)